MTSLGCTSLEGVDARCGYRQVKYRSGAIAQRKSNGGHVIGFHFSITKNVQYSCQKQTTPLGFCGGPGNSSLCVCSVA